MQITTKKIAKTGQRRRMIISKYSLRWRREDVKSVSCIRFLEIALWYYNYVIGLNNDVFMFISI